MRQALGAGRGTVGTAGTVRAVGVSGANISPDSGRRGPSSPAADTRARASAAVNRSSWPSSTAVDRHPTFLGHPPTRQLPSSAFTPARSNSTARDTADPPHPEFLM